MRKYLIKAGAVTCMAAGLLFAPVFPAFVQPHVAAEESKPLENPPPQVINQLLTEAALEEGIPPEVVKAVAKKESGWKHYKDGKLHVSGDGGYGIMQITNFAGLEEDKERIKSDIHENIKAGVKILKELYHRTDLPKVKNAGPQHLESWYFPVMAYNGIKPTNSPLVQGTGERNETRDERKGAYQEDVFAFMELDSDLPTYSLRQFPFTVDDFAYNPESAENIQFNVKEYTVKNLHTSAYFFETGDRVEVVNAAHVNLRQNPRTDEPEMMKVTKGTVLTIVGPFVYDERLESENPFVYYPVKTADGKTGYVASSYLQEASAPAKFELTFTDITEEFEDAIAFLVSKGIKGKDEHAFGTYQNIKRVEAAVMLVRAVGLDLENAPPSGFTDVPSWAVKEVNALKAAGITDGYTKTSFNPYAEITRGDLAVWIERAYQLQGTVEPFPFNDVNERQRKSVAALVKHKVTNGTSAVTFSPNANAKRGHYALFLYRAATIEQ